MADCHAPVLELLPRCAGLVLALALCGLAAIVPDLIHSDDTERMVEKSSSMESSHALSSFMM